MAELLTFLRYAADVGVFCLELVDPEGVKAPIVFCGSNIDQLREEADAYSATHCVTEPCL
jgi:hypothetical protein